MNWENIDLNSGYEISRDVLDGYSVSELMVELDCNFDKKDLNKEKVLAHIKSVLNSRLEDALEIFGNNIENIVSKAKENRE